MTCCGGSIQSVVTKGKKRYVIEGGTEALMAAALAVGAQLVGVSEIAAAIVRAVPILKSIDIIRY